MLQSPLLTEDRLEFARHGPAQLDIIVVRRHVSNSLMCMTSVISGIGWVWTTVSENYSGCQKQSERVDIFK